MRLTSKLARWENSCPPASPNSLNHHKRLKLAFDSNIFRDLKTHQLVRSLRGSDGGYFLSKDPNEISVAFIIRIIEGPIALVPCVSERFYSKCEECGDENTCRIRRLFAEVRNEMLDILDRSIVELANVDKSNIHQFPSTEG